MREWLAEILVTTLMLTMVLVMVGTWVAGARHRLAVAEAESANLAVAIAARSDEGYCAGDLRKVLRRLLQSCGLVEGGKVRGCQPAEARGLATLSGADFNQLIVPMRERAAIVQFDGGSAELGLDDRVLLDRVYADRRGGSYFLVVARASPDGDQIANRALSEGRGQAVLEHLRLRFPTAQLDEEVALMWLGEEFAQLDDTFCAWTRSGDETQCDTLALNRSAFVTWVDCRL